MVEPIRIEGLNAINRALRRIDAEAPKGLRLAHNEAANIVVDTARRKMPRRSGRAQAAVKARSTRTATRVSAGSSRAPYVPWLDYGGEGRVKGRPAYRTFEKGGRYVYPAFHERHGDVQKALEDGLLTVIRAAGLEVD
ncbi:HK97 gp10 family phage protein [Micromonospora sp. 15K316]|nr:HK97 gp10 family phage protein [Micromonospora sp. KC723]TDC35687.1 HK97 gp10 family phage protein [Micromonospora sp. 15K316]